MHIRFTQDFDYRPTPYTTVAYLAGMEKTVKRECGEQAIAAGKAKEVKPAEKSDHGVQD